MMIDSNTKFAWFESVKKADLQNLLYLYKNNKNIIELRDDDNNTALLNACTMPNEAKTKLIKFLIDCNANVNVCSIPPPGNCINIPSNHFHGGTTPLALCCSSDTDIETIELLLKKGSAIDTTETRIINTDSPIDAKNIIPGVGRTCLTTLIAKKRFTLLQYIINYCNSNKIDLKNIIKYKDPISGLTLLHRAAITNDIIIIKLLIDQFNNGDEIKQILYIKDNTKSIPLHHAVENCNKNTEIIEYLMKLAGRNSIKELDIDGKTPFDYSRDINIARFIKDTYEKN